jgi:hypothetical protein
VLDDAKIDSLAEPSNGVGFWVRHSLKGQLFDELCRDEVLLDIVINDEV